jgi:DNA-binding NarL/FixJ family response regulator
LAKRRQCLEQVKANLRDLQGFFDAKHRLAKVDLWLDERIAELHAQADGRQTIHRREAAEALTAMIARGMTVDEIARMAGMTAETVNGYLRPGT